MKPSETPPAHKLVEDGKPREAGYGAWKQAKIEKGLQQSRDRSSMIPAEQVWRDLGLER